MHVLQRFHKSVDLLFRLKNRMRRVVLRKSRFSQDGSASDSQVTFYEKAVSRIIVDDRKFNRFRRIYDYREILEHVDFDLGKRYLSIILKKNPKILANIDDFRKNDLIGKPRTYDFGDIGRVSPTTLRYIATALEIIDKVGKSKFANIVEIGGGYGGQASILQSLDSFERYYIYDLPEVQVLIQKFSSRREMKNILFPNFADDLNVEFDLVISNYAFSELPREIQNSYIEKVILKSRNGFMIMNSGYSNKTGRSDGKITISEMQAIIPDLEIFPEEPLTSPDNYLLIWRQKND